MLTGSESKLTPKFSGCATGRVAPGNSAAGLIASDT